MSLVENKKLFKPPLARGRSETWYATYRLSRNDFLAAVECAAARVPHPVPGLRWEYEGFRGNRLYIWQPGNPERGCIPSHIEFGLHVYADQVTIHAQTENEVELLLFRGLTTELDNIDHVLQARLTPCTLLSHAQFTDLMKERSPKETI